MRKIRLALFSFLICSTVNASDIKDLTLNEISEKTSQIVSNLIPGEGVTEASIIITENKNPDFEILAVRDILSGDDSNLFTQFSFHNHEVEGDERFIGNIGIGYRVLNEDKTTMFGINSFYDQDFFEDHARASIGLEAKASILDFTFNQYQKLTNQKVVNGNKEQVLSGWETNLSSQVPHMPWIIFNWQGYRHDNEKASEDSKGNIYEFAMYLNPSLEFTYARDNSNTEGVESTNTYRLSFIYPPRNNRPTMLDGFYTEEEFVKENVEAKLKDKVRRNNNLVIEVQGAVIITSK